MTIFTQPYHLLGVSYGPKDDNSWNCVEEYDILLVLFYIFSFLNMILTLCPFTLINSFPVFYVINQAMCACWVWNMFLKSPCYTDFCITYLGMHDHIWVISGCNMKLHSCSQYWKKHSVSIVQIIYNIFIMYRCYNTTVNQNLICMIQHL